MNIAERVKQIRKEARLTQQQFADRLGLKQNSIAQIEGGRNTSDQTIRAICKEFSVNEAWLRDGIGEPHTKQSWEEEVAQFVFSTFQNEEETVQKDFLRVLTRLSPKQWELLGDIAEQFYLARHKDDDAKKES